MNIEAKNLSKIYGDGENRVVALDRANLEIVSSDFISIMGPYRLTGDSSAPYLNMR